MPSTELMQATTNMLAIWPHVAESCGGRVAQITGAIACDALAPNPVMNRTTITDPGVDPAKLAADVRGFYTDPSRPWLVLDPYDSVDLSGEGLTMFLSIPCMRREPGTPSSNPTVPGLEIEAVRDAAGINRFKRVLFAGFDLVPWPDDIAALFGAKPLYNEVCSVFVGSIDGEPAGCSVAMRHEDSVGVYLVAVAPNFRRRGIGEAMSWAATLSAPDLPAYLQASSMGYPIYERMGYQVIGSIPLWETPE